MNKEIILSMLCCAFLVAMSCSQAEKAVPLFAADLSKRRTRNKRIHRFPGQTW